MPLPDTCPTRSQLGATFVDDVPVIDPTRNLGADTVNATLDNVAALIACAPLGWALVGSAGTLTAAGGRLAGATVAHPSTGHYQITPAAGGTPIYQAALVTPQDSSLPTIAHGRVVPATDGRIDTLVYRAIAAAYTDVDHLVVVF